MISDTTATDALSALTMFRDLDTATIHEAQGRSGDLPASIKPVRPEFRLCGPAFTVESPWGDNLWLHHAIYAANAGDILVVRVAETGEDDPDAGYWGEIMSHAAVARGLGGLLINACVHDSARLPEVGLPIFATGLCIRGTEKDPSRSGFLNRPVQLGRTVVSPGDLVVGDLDGAVVVPRDSLSLVAEKSQRRMDSEDNIIDRLRSGESTLDIYGLKKGDER